MPMKLLFLLVAAVLAAAATATAQAAELTAAESTWLRAAAPVLSFARTQGLPLKVVVQPQDTPGETPVGLAFVEGECVLVLSMRGNREAQVMLEGVAPDLLGPVIEAMAAHELGHCWRHVQRAWGSLPQGLAEALGFSPLAEEQAGVLRDLWRTRREEGFADLVGLAWTRKHHPQRYEELHAWYQTQRAIQPLRGGPHDTRVWIRLAADRTAFKPAASIFEQAEPLWQTGLLHDF